MNTIAEIKSSETSQSIFVSNKPSWSSIESNALYLFNWTQTSLLDYTNLHGMVRDEDIQNVEYTQIDKLINFNYTLRKPIKVRIIKNLSGEVIGDIEELELYSFGNNEFEVLREINEELPDLFEDLRDIGDDNLGKFPKKWKAILKKYINENKRLYRK